MIGELWDDPEDRQPDDELDDEPDALDDDPALDDELETWKLRARLREAAGELPEDS